MRCELDSCGFWLYFFLRIDRTDWRSSWYVWFGFCSTDTPAARQLSVVSKSSKEKPGSRSLTQRLHECLYTDRTMVRDMKV